jgi:hypothetical protein
MENGRIIAKNKLNCFLLNPGYFSILVLGDNGVGKIFTINTVLKENNIDDFSTYYPFEIGETEKEIESIFSKDFIIIKNIEELTEKQQLILTKALSTGNDGKVGLSENKGLKRIIFTSSFQVDQLTSGTNRLNVRFWDRISQLVVKLPSISPSEILTDFENIWNYMDFKEFPKLPQDGEFQHWLKTNCSSFSGNFRDLDKIAILWHQYRIIEYGDAKQNFKSDVEARIFRKVRADFETFNHFPTQKTDTSNIFEFEKGKTWERIEREFQSAFKSWVKDNYPSIKQATKELNMPSRKMDKW